MEYGAISCPSEIGFGFLLDKQQPCFPVSSNFGVLGWTHQVDPVGENA